MFPVAVFIQVEDLMVWGGKKMMYLIFHLGRPHAVFTVVPRLRGKKYSKVQKIVTFGDYVFLSMRKEVQGITFRNC